jgi:hypothetical protein
MHAATTLTGGAELDEPPLLMLELPDPELLLPFDDIEPEPELPLPPPPCALPAGEALLPLLPAVVLEVPLEPVLDIGDWPADPLGPPPAAVWL